MKFAETASVSALFLARLGNTSASVLKVTWEKEQCSGDGLRDNEDVIGSLGHMSLISSDVCVFLSVAVALKNTGMCTTVK